MLPCRMRAVSSSSRHPLPAGRWRVRRRPGSVPPFWRKILEVEGAAGYARARDRLLVLEACRIPCRTVCFGGQLCAYVPPLLEQRARLELTEFVQEQKPRPPRTPWRPFPYSYLSILALLPLVLWHGWRAGWWPVPVCLPPPETWATAGMLDAVRVRVFGEWYRVVTALTLHAGLTHLCGNVVFGALFLILLARCVGPGSAVLLTLLGGAAGNPLTVPLRPGAFTSLGFSSALFAAIGGLAGAMARRERHWRKAMLPVAAGAALLAMLGTEGENTDYLAHVAGLVCGLALGLLPLRRVGVRPSALRQAAAFALALALPAAAWLWAFAAAGR